MVKNKDDFLSVVDGLAWLQLTNCAELVGYCVEHGQRLLVYKYISRGHSTICYVVQQIILWDYPGICV